MAAMALGPPCPPKSLSSACPGGAPKCPTPCSRSFVTRCVPPGCRVCPGRWFLSPAVSTQQHPEPSTPIQEQSSPQGAQHPSIGSHEVLNAIHEYPAPKTPVSLTHLVSQPPGRGGPHLGLVPLVKSPPSFSPEPLGSRAPSLEQPTCLPQRPPCSAARESGDGPVPEGVQRKV